MTTFVQAPFRKIVVLLAVYLKSLPEYPSGMVTRIGPSKPLRHFLKEWRKHKGLTQQQLADRMPHGDDGKPTGKDVISRWERNERGISMDVQAALAEALGIDPASLFRDPAMPSADELMKRASPETRKAIFAVIETMLKTGTGK